VLIARNLGTGQPVTLGYLDEHNPRAVRRFLEPLVQRLGVSVIVTDENGSPDRARLQDLAGDGWRIAPVRLLIGLIGVRRLGKVALTQFDHFAHRRWDKHVLSHELYC